jgi:hypothetical protein
MKLNSFCNKVCILIGCMSIVCACKVVIIRGNAFEHLPPEQKAIVKPLENFTALDTNSIYEITGAQLLKELNKHEQSLVYVFKSGCTSENCVPLSIVEDYAKEKHLNLFLVLSSYSKLELTLVQNTNAPLFAINADHYGNPNNSKYIQAFLNELGYQKVLAQSKIRGSYLFFKGSELVEIKQKL